MKNHIVFHLLFHLISKLYRERITTFSCSPNTIKLLKQVAEQVRARLLFYTQEMFTLRLCCIN